MSPSHPTADENGFRRDVIDMVRKLGVPVVRYPGGNFVSGFNWEDSIGPRDQRPKRLDLAWFTTETNEVGLHEFVDWAKKADTQVMYAVNLGSRGRGRRPGTWWNMPIIPPAATGATCAFRTARRIPSASSSGALATKWTAPGRCGHKTATEYGRTACEAGKMMKWVDPTIELVACGSSSYEMSTFGRWEWTRCWTNATIRSIM